MWICAVFDGLCKRLMEISDFLSTRLCSAGEAVEVLAQTAGTDMISTVDSGFYQRKEKGRPLEVVAPLLTAYPD